MSDPNDFNTTVIHEFRANEGRVGGFFAGKPVLLLHHTGAKTGASRINPLMYRRSGGGYVVFASKGGAPDNPDWFRNLQTHPEASIEVGTDTVDVRARVADPEERDTLWTLQKSDFPQFADYEKSTSRIIPVVVLEPR